MTTEHLPECGATFISDPCICPWLRACEQRVREEESRNVIGSVSLAAIGEANLQQYQLGFSEGLDAAREAVASMVIETVGNSAATVDQALAAIDELCNPPSLPPTTGRAHKY